MNVSQHTWSPKSVSAVPDRKQIEMQRGLMGKSAVMHPWLLDSGCFDVLVTNLSALSQPTNLLLRRVVLYSGGNRV
jgi:hypothetical protein